MNILINIIITASITFASFFAVQNYVPLKYLETKTVHKLGTSVTTIQSTDTLKNSRTTINDNFTALNAGKIEISTTTLPLITTLSGLTSANALTSASALATVGTITSGTWSGTAILTAKGGTGSTTLAANQLLLGNGTGNIGIVSGLGTTGQYLTSNGAGTAPSWQTSAVDTAINYTWTGGHTWTASTTHSATTTILANSATNNALVLNGIAYKFPATQSASSTVLATNGAGSLSWVDVPNSFSFGATTTSAGAVASIIYPHNLGRIPIMLKLELFTTTTTGTDVVSVNILGQATSTVATQTCVYKADNLTSNTVVQSSCGSGDILRVDSPGGGGGNTRIQVQLTALTSTTFTLNWSDNDSGGNNTDRVMLYTLY